MCSSDLIIEENTTVFTGISKAGGFIGYGGSSQVKVLRLKKDRSGYETIWIDIKDILEGGSTQDLIIQPGDMIEVLTGKFSITGSILKPGEYPLKESTTLLNAITMAGGFNRYGLLGQIKISRWKKDKTGYEIINVNIKEIMGGGASHNFIIQPGDMVEVLEDKFSITGYVLNPGDYPIVENIMVLKAIAMAGGFLKYGISGQIKILRLEKNKIGYRTIQMEIKDILAGGSNQDIIIQPGDIVEVLMGKFSITGNILKPGEYPLKENTTLLSAITMAGGFIKYGLLSQIRVLRSKSAQTGYEKINIIIKDMMLGGSGYNFIIQPGDMIEILEDKFSIIGYVNKPGEYSIVENTTVLKAITMAGGFIKHGVSCQIKIFRLAENKTGYHTIQMNIKDVAAGGIDQDITVQPGDMIDIVVAKFSISGYVVNSGEYPIEEKTTIMKAITMAGGFSRLGSLNQVIVLRPGDNNTGYETIIMTMGNIMNSNPAHDFFIKAGDIIEISEGKFTIYGEVMRPGVYPIEKNSRVLEAISMAGGLNKYGSKNRIKVLRQKKDKEEYEIMKINIEDILNGSISSNIILQPGDIVFVSEGVF